MSAHLQENVWMSQQAEKILLLVSQERARNNGMLVKQKIGHSVPHYVAATADVTLAKS